jgi:hypothetical protein
MLRVFIAVAVLVGFARSAVSAESDTTATTALKRPRPTATAPT